jgi:hypothetical protein
MAYGATMTLPGTDTVYTQDSRGLDGPIGSIKMKANRRGQLDYQMLHEAERLGVNVTAVMNMVIGGAFAEMGSAYSGPYGPRVYDPDPPGPLITTNDCDWGDPPGSDAFYCKNWDNLSQKQWPDSSNYFWIARWALMDSIVARSTP